MRQCVAEQRDARYRSSLTSRSTRGRSRKRRQAIAMFSAALISSSAPAAQKANDAGGIFARAWSSSASKSALSTAFLQKFHSGHIPAASCHNSRADCKPDCTNLIAIAVPFGASSRQNCRRAAGTTMGIRAANREYERWLAASCTAISSRPTSGKSTRRCATAPSPFCAPPIGAGRRRSSTSVPISPTRRGAGGRRHPSGEFRHLDATRKAV